MTNRYVRVNISLPRELFSELKENLPSRKMSAFLSEAAKEKINRAKKEEALRELLKAPPTFKEIKDSSNYIKKMRRLEEKRLEKLGV